MFTLNLDSELEMALRDVAQQEHASPEEFIKRLIDQRLTKKTEDFFDLLPKIPCFENKDPLQLQKELCDKWN
jgi:hypothetical protein